MGKLILASIWWFKRSARPQCHKRGSVETPGGRPTASFGHHITPYIVCIAFKWVYKDFGVWEIVFKMVWVYGKTDCGIILMIQWVCITLKPKKGVSGDPWRSPHRLFLIIISHLISFVLLWSCAFKDFGIWGKLFWSSLDDLRDLSNPNATERGLRRPLEVTI